MTSSISYKRSDVLESINWKTIKIPTLDTIREVIKEKSWKIVQSNDKQNLCAGSIKLIVLMKLSVWKIIEDLSFKRVYKKQNCARLNSGLIDSETEIPFNEESEWRDMVIMIPEDEISSTNDNEDITLPNTFECEVTESAIWIAWKINIWWKDINITDYNY